MSTVEIILFVVTLSAFVFLMIKKGRTYQYFIVSTISSVLLCGVRLWEGHELFSAFSNSFGLINLIILVNLIYVGWRKVGQQRDS